MCPSFQATRDEKDSTRGRANLLRLAITGQLGFEGFTDPARPRRARPVPRMQGVQERVSHQRRHGPAQGRVLASILSEARFTLAQPGLRPCGRAGSGRIGSGTGLELADAERSVALVERHVSGNRSPPCASGFARRSLVRRFSSLLGNAGADRVAQRSCSSPIRLPITFSPKSGPRRSNCFSGRAAPSRSARRVCAAAAGR